jgi:hypothetical protein
MALIHDIIGDFLSTPACVPSESVLSPRDSDDTSNRASYADHWWRHIEDGERPKEIRSSSPPSASQWNLDAISLLGSLHRNTYC